MGSKMIKGGFVRETAVTRLLVLELGLKSGRAFAIAKRNTKLHREAKNKQSNDAEGVFRENESTT